MWEPCDSNICDCDGALCVDDDSLARSTDASDAYEPIDPVNDLTDDGIRRAFDVPSHEDRRTIHYVDSRAFTVTTPDGEYEVQLMKIKARLRQDYKNRTFWVGYQVTRPADVHHGKIGGVRFDNLLILNEDTLNAKGVDVDENLGVIVRGFKPGG
jgi:hypothetical protein